MAARSTPSRKRPAAADYATSGLWGFGDELKRQAPLPPTEVVRFYLKLTPEAKACSPVSLGELEGMRAAKAPIGYPYASLDRCEQQFIVDRSILSGVPDILQSTIADYLGQGTARARALPASQAEAIKVQDLKDAIAADFKTAEDADPRNLPYIRFAVPQLIRMGYLGNRFETIVRQLRLVLQSNTPPQVLLQYLQALSLYPDILAQVSSVVRSNLFITLLEKVPTDELVDFALTYLYPLNFNDLSLSFIDYFSRISNHIPGTNPVYVKLLQKILQINTDSAIEAAINFEDEAKLSDEAQLSLILFLRHTGCNAEFPFAQLEAAQSLPFNDQRLESYVKFLESRRLIDLINKKPLTSEDVKQLTSALTSSAAAGAPKDLGRCVESTFWKYDPETFDAISKVIIDSFNRLGGFKSKLVHAWFNIMIQNVRMDVLNALLEQVDPHQRHRVIRNFMLRTPLLTQQISELNLTPEEVGSIKTQWAAMGIPL
jgi:hypothetical protein